MRYSLLALLLVAILGCESGSEPAKPSSTTPDAVTVKKHMAPDQLELGDPVVNSIGMVLVPIPEGNFMMGMGDADVQDRGYPVPRRVEITQPFYLGAFEVTQGQYEEVMGENPSAFKGAKNLPVETVYWEDVVEFCQKLSALPKEKAAGRTYRLPTEAEWEYACRAGTTTKYSFGDDAKKLGDYAWYRGNSGHQKNRESGQYSNLVGTKLPNPWGLYDMHGNVNEWCLASQPIDTQGNIVQDPSDPLPLIRGGNWNSDAFLCRSGLRHRQVTGSPTGFRVVQVPLQGKNP